MWRTRGIFFTLASFLLWGLRSARRKRSISVYGAPIFLLSAGQTSFWWILFSRCWYSWMIPYPGPGGPRRPGSEWCRRSERSRSGYHHCPRVQGWTPKFRRRWFMRGHDSIVPHCIVSGVSAGGFVRGRGKARMGVGGDPFPTVGAVWGGTPHCSHSSPAKCVRWPRTGRRQLEKVQAIRSQTHEVTRPSRSLIKHGIHSLDY